MVLAASTLPVEQHYEVAINLLSQVGTYSDMSFDTEMSTARIPTAIIIAFLPCLAF